MTAATTPRLRRLAGKLTSPLLPEDYLGLVNPLWATSELRGRVESVHWETPGAATLEIRPGGAWAGHRPGQWVRIGIDINGVRHWRSYSISSAPFSATGGDRIAITVKAAGLVSEHLVRRVRSGTIIRLDQAAGEFVLPPEPPERVLFLTAGSGITPVMSMLRALARSAETVSGRLSGGAPAPFPDTVLVHSAPTRRDVIFGAELRRLAARTPNFRLHEQHTRTAGRLGPQELARLVPDLAQRSTWACGPTAMLDALSLDDLHVEHFRPPVPAATGDGGLVRFTTSAVDVRADGATPLLVAGEEAGALLPSGCRMGICFSCVGRLTAGRVRDLRTGEVHGEEGDIIQTCVSAAAGPCSIEL